MVKWTTPIRALGSTICGEPHCLCLLCLPLRLRVGPEMRIGHRRYVRVGRTRGGKIAQGVSCYCFVDGRQASCRRRPVTLRGCDLRAKGRSIEGQTYLLSTLDLKGRSRTYTPCCSRSTPVRATACSALLLSDTRFQNLRESRREPLRELQHAVRRG